jgi:hypothetical protein
MKIFTLVAVLCSTLLTYAALAQDNNWPKTATTPEGAVLKLYEWQPESFADNTLQAHAAISVLEKGKTDPVFGVAWLKATTENDGQQVVVKSIYITNIKLPGETNDDKLESLANTMEDQVASWNLAFSKSELQVALDLNKTQTNLAGQINNTPPKILYANTPSILVLIDGAPKLQRNNDWGVEAVVNTPFVIVKNDERYYLYGGKHWYIANAVTGSYKMVSDVPHNLEKIEAAVKDAAKNNSEEGKETDANTIYNIVVSTEPAELIQSKGEANFAAVEGTGLLYVSNSENDIFMDINSQEYYVLISGRWYHSKTLSGNWQYVASDKLPADFARIPKGSPKDNVLASVAGTAEASDAVADAQVPQTAKVERSKVHADIDYDGDPEFEDIDGTDMAYAINSPVSVIRWRGRYYSVDDGVWFESRSAIGPWSVCLVRPYAVSLIPPRYPVYYMKYVYIYDVGPDYVYMGYTPGYLNAYVYGPTVVYGTGFYYRPWYGRHYYPRPCTWGYAVRYNPWYGWGFGFSYWDDWFHVSIGYGSPYSWGPWGCGGWWGPRVYYPSYYGSSYYYRGGYYGYNSYNSYNAYRRQNNVTIVNNYYNNTNIYRNRTGVVSNNSPRFNGPVSARNNGRQEWANNNGRFNRGFERNSQPNNNRLEETRNRPVRPYDPNNNGRISDPNRGYNRERNTQPADGNNRGWRTPGSDNNGRIVVGPRNSEPRSTEPIDRSYRGNSPVREMPNREAQPQNREPVRRYEQPGNFPNNGRQENRGYDNGSENRSPRAYEPRAYEPSQRSYEPRQRSYEPSPGGNQGGYGGGRVMQQPQSRPEPPSGGSGGGGFSPAPRMERHDGGGGNGGGAVSRPSGGGNSEGRSSGGDFGRGGRRGR